MIESRTASAAQQDPALTVEALNRRVRECLERQFPLLRVAGEISNLTYAASGHVYFTLKDAAAQVRCVMWRSRAQTLGWRLEQGQQVELRAQVSFYEPRGEFQLTVEQIRKAGQGDLYERFLRLKAELEKEGLFAVDRKRPLPAYPRHVAIVTSPQAATLRDVLTALHRRAPHLRITMIPTPVQGEGAADRIADALGVAGSSGADLVLLCRGGGSIEDLWSFNEAVVARAIAACPIPVVSGIGHETDFTIADFAADLRAATPTAAAELCCPATADLLHRLQMQQARLQRAVTRLLADRQQQLDWLDRRLLHPHQRLQQHRETLAVLQRRLMHALPRAAEQSQLRLNHAAQRLQASRPLPALQQSRLDHLAIRLNQQARWAVSRRMSQLEILGGSLRQLDPDAVLLRGYALAIGDDGRIIRDASTLASGSRIRLNFARGEADARIERVVAPPEAD